MKTVFDNKTEAMAALYSDTEAANIRFDSLLHTFSNLHKSSDNAVLFSAPGRIELCGNHTDHQGGRVLAAAIDKDTVAAAWYNGTDSVRIRSCGQRPFSVDICRTMPLYEERGKSSAMVRGIISYIKSHGGNVCGVDICIDSTIPTGSGISSSAAFENLVSEVLNTMCNDGRFSPLEIAVMGQYAESEFFGKPCGFMDQTASAYGGCLHINFSGKVPNVLPVNPESLTENYSIFVVHTGGSHSKLGKDYSHIVREMHSVAEFFGADRLCDVDEAEFYRCLSAVKESAGDRAVLRSMHYYEENRRVLNALASLETGNTDAFLESINESGDSSVLLLQNVYLDYLHDKSLALALALTKRFFAISGCQGACRIHGGGFMGTILAIIPHEFSCEYVQYMQNVFPSCSLHNVTVRKYGAIPLCITPVKKSVH